MGFYIETGETKNKANDIVKQFGGRIVSLDTAKQVIKDHPEQGVIVVVEMPMWDAAGFCYSEQEFEAFTHPGDTRPKKYIIMDRKLAEKLSGYKE